jgi:hypothetical protein
VRSPLSSFGGHSDLFTAADVVSLSVLAVRPAVSRTCPPRSVRLRGSGRGAAGSVAGLPQLGADFCSADQEQRSDGVECVLAHRASEEGIGDVECERDRATEDRQSPCQLQLIRRFRSGEGEGPDIAEAGGTASVPPDAV